MIFNTVQKIELICICNIIFAKSNQNATQNSYKKYMKFQNSKLPNQPKSQILYDKKSPPQDLEGLCRQLPPPF